MRRNLPTASSPVPSTQTFDAHLQHGSIFGAAAINNNNSIDPAFSGSHQTTPQHFNFSPGSHAQLSFQHISGNGATHQPTYQSSLPPELEAHLKRADAFFIGIGGVPGGDYDYSSMDFPEKQAMFGDTLDAPSASQTGPQPQYGLNRNSAHLGSVPASFDGQLPTSIQSNSEPPPAYQFNQQQSPMLMLMLNSACIPHPHQSYEHQPMHHHIPRDPNVSTQYDDPSHATCPQAFEHAPANGTSDQSGGNTQSNQESMPQTQTISLNGNKRRSSEISGEGAASSVADPKKKRKTATKKEIVDWYPTTFGNGYKGMTAEAAEERLITRIPMTLAEEDDLETVMDNEAYWVRRLMSAFDKQYSAVPVMEDFKELLHIYKPWQDEHYSKVMRVIDGDDIGNLVEAAATAVYSKIISSHKTKTLDQQGSSFIYDRTFICSKRLIGCVEAMEKLTIIREDLIDNMRVAELISNPANMVKRKESNKRDNERKKIPAAEEKKLQEQTSESAKKLKELNRESKDQDDSYDSKAENAGFAGSEVSMIGFDED